MALIDAMAASDTIKECEKHQKKSLKQIRELIYEIVMKRKMRTDIGLNYAVSTLGKPPDLREIRDDTKKVLLKFTRCDNLAANLSKGLTNTAKEKQYDLNGHRVREPK